jgi:hypothetical protein
MRKMKVEQTSHILKASTIPKIFSVCFSIVVYRQS